jgi:hypothetical protein
MTEAQLDGPSQSEWSFGDLGEGRSRNLENAPSFNEIVRMLRQAFQACVADGHALASEPANSGRRAVIQFRVNPELYDAFFNSRTGYRAQYWRSTEHGVSENAYLVGNLLAVLCDVPQWPHSENWTLSGEVAMLSLVCAGAKVWVNEADYRANFIECPRLLVPQWTRDTREIPERCCAPLPQDCWLDLKGCFVEGRSIRLSKDRYVRGQQIHETGWTGDTKA